MFFTAFTESVPVPAAELSSFTGYTYILSRAWVTTDGVWISNWILDHVQVVITSVALSPIHTLYISVQHALSLLSLLHLHQLFPGSSFQRRTFPLLWVPKLSLCLSYQLLTETAHTDWTIAVLQLTFTHSPTNSLHSTHWTKLGRVIQPQSRPNRKHRSSVDVGDMVSCVI
jgi:hypothetical protein